MYLSEGSEFGSQLQKRHLSSLRRILGVKNSTTNWAVLRECGQEHQSSAMFKQKMLRATQVPMQEFICNLRFRHLKVWREADFSCPRAVNKKAVTYHKWCGSSESGPRGSPFSIPPTCTRIWTNMC